MEDVETIIDSSGILVFVIALTGEREQNSIQAWKYDGKNSNILFWILVHCSTWVNILNKDECILLVNVSFLYSNRWSSADFTGDCLYDWMNPKSTCFHHLRNEQTFYDYWGVVFFYSSKPHPTTFYWIKLQSSVCPYSVLCAFKNNVETPSKPVDPRH